MLFLFEFNNVVKRGVAFYTVLPFFCFGYFLAPSLARRGLIQTLSESACIFIDLD